MLSAAAATGGRETPSRGRRTTLAPPLAKWILNHFQEVGFVSLSESGFRVSRVLAHARTRSSLMVSRHGLEIWAAHSSLSELNAMHHAQVQCLEYTKLAHIA